MSIRRIYHKEGQGFTTIYSDEKIEKVNPIEYYEKHEVIKRANQLRDIFVLQFPELASNLGFKFFIGEALKTMDGFFENIEKADVQPNFLELLNTDKKKDQIKLLKEASLDPEQLISLIFKSYSDYGYLYSRYLFETIPSGFEKKKFPELYELKEDGKIWKVGETNLTDGELKHIVENRKVIVSHFFDREDVWHCLFLTYKSVGGLENWKNGQPHFHYISSSFGIGRQEFIDSMKNGKYKSTSIHIDLLGYGEQPDQK